MHITLKQLQIFLSVTQHKSLTAAAEHLCLTKAAVSMAIKQLETQFDRPLFDRVNHRLILNPSGRLILPLVDEICHRSQDLSQVFQTQQALFGPLNLGASDTIGNQMLPFLLRDFQQQTQHTHQTATISNTATICQKLIDYELDVGLVEGQVHHKQVSMHSWHQDQMCVVCSPSHPLVKHWEISHDSNQSLHQASDFTTNLAQTSDKSSPSDIKIAIHQLENSLWLTREPGSGTREFFLQNLAPRLKHWQIAFELNTTEAIINATTANLGLACLSKLSAQHAIDDGRVCELQLPLDMTRQFWLLTHKNKYHSPLIDTFIEFCQTWRPVMSV
ncbi:MAG: LysR family transcriptional regulator [Vibrio sp.]